MEAGEAHALLRRLGEEAYSSNLALRHRHVPQATHHAKRSTTPRPDQQRTFGVHDEIEALDWAALIKLIFSIPKAILGLIIFAGIFLFGLFGPLLFVPLIVFVLFTGIFRQILKQEQRDSLNAVVKRINAFAAEYQG